MKTALIGFTKNSGTIMQKLRKGFGEQGISCEVWLKRKGVSREEAHHSKHALNAGRISSI